MLKVDNLSYAYTDKYLFENLNLYLDIKTITKVSGSNGSGKTTFLKNISGILQDYEGEISVSYTHLTLPTKRIV